MKSCEFTTSEASTKSWFRTNGLIDKFLNILDLNKFRIKNTEFSNYAKTQYGVEGRLFYEEQSGKKAFPNTTLFHQIDAAKGNWYKENEYLKDMFKNNPTANIVINRFDEFLKTPYAGGIKELSLISKLMQQNNTTSYPITVEAFAPENGEDNIQCFI